MFAWHTAVVSLRDGWASRLSLLQVQDIVLQMDLALGLVQGLADLVQKSYHRRRQ